MVVCILLMDFFVGLCFVIWMVERVMFRVNVLFFSFFMLKFYIFRNIKLFFLFFFIWNEWVINVYDCVYFLV